MPLTDTLVVFHELMYVASVLACQQRVPTPSKVKGAVMVDVTGLHVAPVPDVGLGEAPTVWVGVKVRVGVLLATTTGVAVRVDVFVAPTTAVDVRVGVIVAPGVDVRVGVAVITRPVAVRVGVRVRVTVETGAVGVLVFVGVDETTGVAVTVP